LSTLKILEIRKSLIKKGFIEEPDGKHIYYFFYYEGKKSSISTHISHGDIEIGDPLIHDMSKETNLTKREFIKLIDCHMSMGQYIKIQKGKNVLK
jgi:hypothetical protein